MATNDEIRALVKSEIQKRAPDTPERVKESVAQAIARYTDDPDAVVERIKRLYPEPTPDAAKEDSAQ